MPKIPLFSIFAGLVGEGNLKFVGELSNKSGIFRVLSSRLVRSPKRQISTNYGIDNGLPKSLDFRDSRMTNLNRSKTFMKPVGSFPKWMACGVAIAALYIVSSAEAAPGKATVSGLKDGSGQYSESKGGQWMTLNDGKVLGPGAAVKSGAGAYVNLNLGPAGTVGLQPDTTLSLDNLDVNKTGADTVVQVMLDLRAGTIRGEVGKLSSASKYEVRTPQTVFGIKTTNGPAKYVISADGKHTMIDGSAVIVYTNPSTGAMSTHTVDPGQTFIPPVTPGTPGIQPTVRPSIPDDVPHGGPNPPPGVTPIVVVPTPVEFVSPGTGSTGAQ